MPQRGWHRTVGGRTLGAWVAGGAGKGRRAGAADGEGWRVGAAVVVLRWE